jgi:hypothetical protein
MMRRWLANLVASTLLAVSLIVLGSWALSHRATHIIAVFRPTAAAYALWAGEGRLQLQYYVVPRGLATVPDHTTVQVRTAPPSKLLAGGTFWSERGFHYYRSTRDADRSLIVPHWFVLLIIAPLPLWHFARIVRRRRRLHRGLCPNCGYDLTANASGVCPECGGPAPAPPA